MTVIGSILALRVCRSGVNRTSNVYRSGKRLGRPPIPRARRKAKMFSLRLTAEEQRLIEDAAEVCGMRTSRWSLEILVETAKMQLANVC